MVDSYYIQNLLSVSVGCVFQFVITASFYLFYVGRKNRLYNLLAWVLLFWGLVEFRNLILLIFDLNPIVWTGDYSYIIEMFSVPITVAFLIELVYPKSITLRNIIYVLLPYLLSTILSLFIPIDKILIINFCISLLYCLIAFAATMVSIPMYKNWLKNNYSNTRNFSVIWMWLILLIFVFLSILWIFTALYYNIFVEIIFNFLKPLCWVGVFYFVYKQQKELSYIVENDFFNNDISKTDENNKSQINVESVRNEKNYFIGFDLRLNNVFVEPKLFLNKSLTLAELALEMNTNRTYLSYYFNNVLHVTFYDYVNEYRLEYASQMLINKPDMPIEEVGELSGFNSLSTFRRSFNKYFGCNPKEYRKINTGS